MARKRRGRFLGMPYDWHRPTVERLRSRVWNPEEPRIVVPHAFGWGYTFNLAAIIRRMSGGRRPRGT